MNAHSDTLRRALCVLCVIENDSCFVCPLDVCVTAHSMYSYYLDIDKAKQVKEIRDPDLVWPLSMCVLQDHFILVLDHNGKCVHVVDSDRDYEIVNKIPNISASCASTLGSRIVMTRERQVSVYEVGDLTTSTPFTLIREYDEWDKSVDFGCPYFLDEDTILVVNGAEFWIYTISTPSCLNRPMNPVFVPVSVSRIDLCDICVHPCYPSLLLITNFGANNVFVYSIEQRQITTVIAAPTIDDSSCVGLNGIACVSSNQVIAVCVNTAQLLVMEWAETQVSPTSIVFKDWHRGIRILEHRGKLLLSQTRDARVTVFE
eukprot:PhF_6_TR23329/c0_g2_i3/m.33020